MWKIFFLTNVLKSVWKGFSQIRAFPVLTVRFHIILLGLEFRTFNDIRVPALFTAFFSRSAYNVLDLFLFTCDCWPLSIHNVVVGVIRVQGGGLVSPPPPSFTLTAKCTVITTLLVEGRGQQTEVFIHFVICVFSATFYLKRYNSFHFLKLFRLFICYTRLLLLICLECCCIYIIFTRLSLLICLECCCFTSIV